MSNAVVTALRPDLVATADCRACSPVVQSTRMAVSRLRRAGILLLVLWLTADVAAFGFCRGELTTGAGQSAMISAADTAGADTSSSCTGHHCFCCSSGAEVMSCDLSVEGQVVRIAPQPAANPPDFRLSDTSPPPRS